MILKQNIKVLMIILVCYELTGPSGSMIVQVADMCPVSGNSVCVGIHFFISFTLSLLFFLIYIFCFGIFLILSCTGDMDHFDLGPNSTTFAKVADSSWGNTLITKVLLLLPSLFSPLVFFLNFFY